MLFPSLVHQYSSLKSPSQQIRGLISLLLARSSSKKASKLIALGRTFELDIPYFASKDVLSSLLIFMHFENRAFLISGSPAIIAASSTVYAYKQSHTLILNLRCYLAYIYTTAFLDFLKNVSGWNKASSPQQVPNTSHILTEAKLYQQA